MNKKIKINLSKLYSKIVYKGMIVTFKRCFRIRKTLRCILIIKIVFSEIQIILQSKEIDFNVYNQQLNFIKNNREIRLLFMEIVFSYLIIKKF